MKISVVSPVFKAENTIDELVNRIVHNLEEITKDYEIILVEDGGNDQSWFKIQNIARVNKKVKGIKLSRNFGQHFAITAGLDQAQGDWVIVMDCDLQDKPEEFKKLVNKTNEGFEVVFACRSNRKDTFLKKLFSKWFYRILSYLTDYKHDETIANFGIYHRKVIKAIVSMREQVRFFPAMVMWVGFSSSKVQVEHGNRFEGKSSYNIMSLFKLAINIILAYSEKPIRLLIKCGMGISFFSFLVALFYIYKWSIGKIEVLGFTTMIVSIWFLSGVIMASLGLVGLYVGKTFEGIRNRPLYIIKETANG